MRNRANSPQPAVIVLAWLRSGQRWFQPSWRSGFGPPPSQRCLRRPL